MDEKLPKSPKTCPMCGESMTEGLMPGFILGTFREPRWIEGVETISYREGGPKTSGKKQYKLTAHRCDGCGFLQLFADRPSRIE
jgi:hypothetical protein